MGNILEKLHRFSNFEFSKYFIVSVTALSIDIGIYSLLIENKLFHQPIAASISYLVGLFFSYILLKIYVFKTGWLQDRKIYEFILFISSGFFGVAITYITVELYINIKNNQSYMAKIIAVGLSFMSVYIVRKKLVFRIKVIK